MTYCNKIKINKMYTQNCVKNVPVNLGVQIRKGDFSQSELIHESNNEKLCPRIQCLPKT